MNKIIKQIPNSITSLNLISGGISIIMAFKGCFVYAFVFMIIASVFDFCDGLAARGLNAYSEIGKELDSLADVVSFGLAPSLILYNYMCTVADAHRFFVFFPLILAAFSAVRLAKFNLDTRQTTSFIGLPTPACGLLIASFIAFCTTPSGAFLHRYIDNSYYIPILSFLLSLLLISEWPMFSLKFHSLKWKDNVIRYIFLITLVPLLLLTIFLHIHWSGFVLMTFLLYLLFNLVNLFVRK